MEIEQSTHHFVVDFVKMYFAHFIYYVFTLKRDETETCNKINK